MSSADELFCSIYKNYMPLLRMIAKRNGIPYDDIEDMVQDTFMSYYGHYPLDWPDYKIRSMLARIMKNRCVDYLRKKDSRPLAYLDPLQIQGYGMDHEKLVGKDSLSILLEQQRYREIVEVMKNMKEDWAQVIMLYVIQERSMEEVSKILGITNAACRTRLTRGRKYLKEHLGLKGSESGKTSSSNGTETSGEPEVSGNM